MRQAVPRAPPTPPLYSAMRIHGYFLRILPVLLTVCSAPHPTPRLDPPRHRSHSSGPAASSVRLHPCGRDPRTGRLCAVATCRTAAAAALAATATHLQQMLNPMGPPASFNTCNPLVVRAVSWGNAYSFRGGVEAMSRTSGCVCVKLLSGTRGVLRHLACC